MVFVQVRLPSGGPARHSHIPAIARESEHQPTRLFARHHAILARSEVELLVKILIYDSRKEVQRSICAARNPKPSMSEIGLKSEMTVGVCQFSRHLGCGRQTRQPTCPLRATPIGCGRRSLARGMDAKRAIPKIFECRSAPVYMAAGLTKGTPLQI